VSHDFINVLAKQTFVEISKVAIVNSKQLAEICIIGWLSSRVVRALHLQLDGHEFDSWPLNWTRLTTLGKLSTPKCLCYQAAGALTGIRCDALALYRWSLGISCCLAEGIRNRDQYSRMCLYGSGTTLVFTCNDYIYTMQTSDGHSVLDTCWFGCRKSIQPMKDPAVVRVTWTSSWKEGWKLNNSMHGKAQHEPAQLSVVLDCKLVPLHNTCQSLPAVCYITSMR